MANTPQPGHRTRKLWVALTAFALIASGIGVFYFRSRQARKQFDEIVRRIEHGDNVQKTLAIRDLYSHVKGPDAFAQAFPSLIRAVSDDSEMVRDAAASALGDLIVRSGSKNAQAFCPEAEQALAVLLSESSPTRGCDLRLISSLSDGTLIPTTGKSLIVVAHLEDTLKFRIWSASGKLVVDTDEKRLMERATQIGNLKKRLENLWPPHELTENEKAELIAAVTSIVDFTAALRARAVRSLGLLAQFGKLGAPPPPLVACLDDQSEIVRAAAVDALIEYQQGPELVVPVALRRIPGETPTALNEFTDVFWHIRLEPSVLPLLIAGLSSENEAVCLSCTAAINHMGRDARPALPAILKLIRKELEIPHPPGSYSRERLIAMASGAIGELLADAEVPPPGTVELLCEVLKGPSEPRQPSAPDRSVPPKASSRELEDKIEFRKAEAAWSLGILGRSAASAVPILLSTFEATPKAPDDLREIIAESLVEITRRTPDEDRVIASLANAWKSAPQKQKIVLARALRALGSKSERLVPDLRQLTPDGSRSRIRRVRYPRSRHEFPVRE